MDARRLVGDCGRAHQALGLSDFAIWARRPIRNRPAYWEGHQSDKIPEPRAAERSMIPPTKRMQ